VPAPEEVQVLERARELEWAPVQVQALEPMQQYRLSRSSRLR
jgi:hypothetical protein